MYARWNESVHLVWTEAPIDKFCQFPQCVVLLESHMIQNMIYVHIRVFFFTNKGIHIIFKTVTFHCVSYHSLQTLWLIRYRLESRNSIKGAFGINSLFIFSSIPDASAVLIINRLAISEIKTQESTKFATLVQLLHINVHEKEPGSCLTTGSSYLLFTIASGSNVLARDCFVLKTQLRAFWITSDTASQRKGKGLT